MMSKKIAVLDTGYESFQYEEELLRENGYDFEVFPGLKSDIDGKIRFASDAVGILIRWTDINDSFLDQTPFLKAIVRYGTGYENIDLEEVSKRGILVSNVNGYASHSVSDHALALMYSCARALPQGQKEVKSLFGAPPVERIMEFHEKKLGIIGLGRIGGTLSNKARYLFKEVLAYDPYIRRDRFAEVGAKEATFDQLLKESDVISLHCNLTEETQGLIDENTFDRMGKVPILINTSRGPVVNESALVKALDNGKIFKAGIDVYNTELADELPQSLIGHPLILTTGHYAWYSERSNIELQRKAADNMLDLLQGRIPEDCLNPDLG